VPFLTKDLARERMRVDRTQLCRIRREFEQVSYESTAQREGLMMMMRGTPTTFRIRSKIKAQGSPACS
jgi:hypothetical protein